MVGLELEKELSFWTTTVDSHVFELPVIRSSRVFEAIFISLLVNLPFGKPSVIRTPGYSNHFSISLEISNK